MNSFIAKPCSRNDIITAVTACLKQRGRKLPGLLIDQLISPSVRLFFLSPSLIYRCVLFYDLPAGQVGTPV
jgi:hypothetical protein